MVDHPDIVNWVKPGELLLTTGYNWPNDAETSRRLVRNLSKVGLAGVVLAVPHFRDHFPPEAIDEARSVGFPLLELPWDVQFSQVTHEILAKIINFQAEIIERSEQLHRALTNAAVTANSLSDPTRCENWWVVRLPSPIHRVSFSALQRWNPKCNRSKGNSSPLYQTRLSTRVTRSGQLV